MLPSQQLPLLLFVKLQAELIRTLPVLAHLGIGSEFATVDLAIKSSREIQT